MVPSTRTVKHQEFRSYASSSSPLRTRAERKEETVPNETLDQGHAVQREQAESGSKESKGARIGLDVQGEAVQGGFAARQESQNQAHQQRQQDNKHQNRYDAASSGRSPKPGSMPSRGEGGNPEHVGFAEQVGGQAASADRLSSSPDKSGVEVGNKDEGRSRSGDEEAQPESILAYFKKRIFGSSSVRSENSKKEK